MAAGGAGELRLPGPQAGGRQAVVRNVLPAAAQRSLGRRVLDGRGRATRAGAEVRVYAEGSRRLIGSGLVDSGSGYNMQNDLPVHIGIGTALRVDVEVTWPGLGKRAATRVTGVQAGERRAILTR